MKFEKVYEAVKGIPFIPVKNARILYDFIIEHKLVNCLELGFAHGVASCYIAAALDELGGGTLTSVDLQEHPFTNPSINDLLSTLGLEKYVTIIREKTGYNWFLHDCIKENTSNNECTPIFDLCIIDGPKNWTIDSSAFFLSDKLLRRNGWIIFDDYNWLYANAATKRVATDGITHRTLSEKELNTPHIKEIFELLVRQHPSYSNFKLHWDGDWAWAQKSKEGARNIAVIAMPNYCKRLKKILKKFIPQLLLFNCWL